MEKNKEELQKAPIDKMEKIREKQIPKVPKKCRLINTTRAPMTIYWNNLGIRLSSKQIVKILDRELLGALHQGVKIIN